MPSKRFFTGALLLLSLAGCVTSGQRGSENAPRVRDFGPPVAALADSPALANTVLEVHMPAWVDGTAILYRLRYSADPSLRPYAHVRWAAPVSHLISQRLRQRLFTASPDSGAKALLRVEIDELSHAFLSPTSSQVELHARLTRIEAGAQTAKQKSLVIVIPAREADANAGIVASMAAGDRLAEEIGAWLREK